MDNLSYKKLLQTKKFPQLENNGEHLKKLRLLQEKMLFIQRDRVKVWTEKCGCGRTSLRMICSGRTDDMLIIGGINVFPSAIKDIISQHVQELSGEFRIILTKPPVGSAMEPSLRIEVEHTGYLGEDALKNFRSNLESEIRQILLFKPEIIFVPPQTLERSVLKSSYLLHAYKNKE